MAEDNSKLWLDRLEDLNRLPYPEEGIRAMKGPLVCALEDRVEDLTRLVAYLSEALDPQHPDRDGLLAKVAVALKGDFIEW
jgi:hypothetical protein